MGKHRKLPPSDPPAPSSEASSLAEVEAGLREAFATCQEMVRGGDAPVQVLRELGGLGRAITSVQAEMRAQTKARQYTARNLPSELVMEYLRLQTSERRGHIVQELLRLDDETSVLG